MVGLLKNYVHKVIFPDGRPGRTTVWTGLSQIFEEDDDRVLARPFRLLDHLAAGWDRDGFHRENLNSISRGCQHELQ